MTQSPSLFRSKLRSMFIILSLLFVTWVIGFFEFVNRIPFLPQMNLSKTNAIIVLTGGSGRLNEGLKLLDEYELADHLFISGVAKGVDLQTLVQLTQRNLQDLTCCISVGYKADNTAGNAKETHDWMKNKGFTSMRLVTSNYHMPRSMVEFSRVMPNSYIIPHAVVTEDFRGPHWWKKTRLLKIVASEYNKLLITYLAGLWPTIGS
tara:strand:+ start:5804 stop:6421 length:618 start_codon:yes stop_codon:yes gene_type:complete